jgi:hypothetical protein
MLDRVRPGCDLRGGQKHQSEETPVAKALQTNDFWSDALTPSLPVIQYRQHKIAICRDFQAL